MKVLYISNSKVPSVEANSLQVMKMCDSFSDHVHDVMLLAKKGSLSKDVFKYYNLKNVFDIRLIPSNILFINMIFMAYHLIKFNPTFAPS